MHFLLFPQGRRRKLLIHRSSTTPPPQQRQHQARLSHLFQSLQLMRERRQLPTQTRLPLKPHLLCSPIPGKRNPVSEFLSLDLPRLLHRRENRPLLRSLNHKELPRPTERYPLMIPRRTRLQKLRNKQHGTDSTMPPRTDYAVDPNEDPHLLSVWTSPIIKSGPQMAKLDACMVLSWMISTGISDFWMSMPETGSATALCSFQQVGLNPYRGRITG